MSAKVTDEKAKARRSVWEGPLFWIAWALIIILPLILVPVLQKRGVINPYYYDVLMRTGIAVVMAVSLNIVNGHLTVKHIFWFHYHGGTNLAKAMTTSKLYFDIQAKLRCLLF